MSSKDLSVVTRCPNFLDEFEEFENNARQRIAPLCASQLPASAASALQSSKHSIDGASKSQVAVSRELQLANAGFGYVMGKVADKAETREERDEIRRDMMEAKRMDQLSALHRNESNNSTAETLALMGAASAFLFVGFTLFFGGKKS